MATKVTTDSDRFDLFQLELIRRIAVAVKQQMTDAGVAENKIQEATEGLTWDIAAILDGCDEELFVGKEPCVPVVTFGLNEELTKLLISEGASWMHEYALGVAESLFVPPQDSK